jgi:acyl-CoA thioesterase I
MGVRSGKRLSRRLRCTLGVPCRSLRLDCRGSTAAAVAVILLSASSLDAQPADSGRVRGDKSELDHSDTQPALVSGGQVNLFGYEGYSLPRIMPIGDSITQAAPGYNSYRRRLWHLLTNAGFEVDFVGSLTTDKSGGLPPKPDFDLDHEGHWGWRVEEILEEIDGWASHAQPDYALIHLGSNDAFKSQSTSSTIDELSQLIDRLRAVNPEIRVLLAKLIPAADPTRNLRLAEVNAEIPALAEAKSTELSPVVVVDHTVGFSTMDLYDGVHPNDVGERKMATNWFNVLAPMLAPVHHPPTITESPQSLTILSGESVSLTVQATGTESLYYQWYEGSSGDIEFPVPGATTATLETPALSVTTSYWVRVTNEAGEADSQSAIITVQYPPQPTVFHSVRLLDGKLRVSISGTVGSRWRLWCWTDEDGWHPMDELETIELGTGENVVDIPIHGISVGLHRLIQEP